METVCASCMNITCVPDDSLQSACCLRYADCCCQHCGCPLFSGQVIEATNSTLDKLLQDDLPIVVDFTASWCRPCRVFAPIFADVAAERCGTMRFVRVDVSNERELANRFGVRGIPTIIIFKHGQILDILSGVEPKAPFMQWLDETLCQLDTNTQL